MAFLPNPAMTAEMSWGDLAAVLGAAFLIGVLIVAMMEYAGRRRMRR